FRHRLGQKCLEDSLHVELADAQATFHGLGERARAGTPDATGHLCALAEYGAGVVVDVAPRHARRHARTHYGADGGSGDRDRLYSELVQRLDHMDMGQSARAAAAESDT